MKKFDYSVVKHYKFYGFVKTVFGPEIGRASCRERVSLQV